MPERGTVKFYNTNKGYGFIKRATGEDVFVHHTAIQGGGYKALSEGEQVEFEIKAGAKGPEAQDVRRVQAGEEL